MIYKRLILTALLFGFIFSGLYSAQNTEIPKKKMTAAGLYITAANAYKEWKKDSSIKIIDIRTPEEYVYVGHPEMAWSVPLFYLKDKWYSGKGRSMVMNKSFKDIITQLFKKEDKIFLVCRSGGRSAMAANILYKAGFKKVYTVIDGFEGDKIKDKSSSSYGLRKKNGWKNSELPWTYKIKKEMLKYSAQ